MHSTVSQQSIWKPPSLVPLELEKLWLPWPAFLEQYVQGKEGEHQFWSVFGDHSEVHLESSLNSSVYGDTVSDIPGGLHEVEARTLRVPA